MRRRQDRAFQNSRRVEGVEAVEEGGVSCRSAGFRTLGESKALKPTLRRDLELRDGFRTLGESKALKLLLHDEIESLKKFQNSRRVEGVEAARPTTPRPCPGCRFRTLGESKALKLMRQQIPRIEIGVSELSASRRR